MSDTVATATLDDLRIAIDRDADVPIGVQIAWTIRARIGDGTFAPGQRLPGLRALADATGVNFNTVRAVYQRLESDGLVNSRRGAGTFVTSTAGVSPRVERIAAGAAIEAHASGIDPRDVAAVLYSSSERAAQLDAERERRQLLRTQIAALEVAVAEIEAERATARTTTAPAGPVSGPRLLDADELERVRAALMLRLASLHEAVEDSTPTAEKASSSGKARKRSVSDVSVRPPKRAAPAKKPRRRRSGTRPATAS